MINDIPSVLADARAAVGTLFHCPGNLGIEFRGIRMHNSPGIGLLAVYVRCMADEELIRRWAIEPLQHGPGLSAEAGPREIAEILPAPRIWILGRLDAVVEAVLDGATAIFIDGSHEALLLGTEESAALPAGETVSQNPQADIFGTELIRNIALIRRRLRDPGLMAEPQELPRHRGSIALLYLADRADTQLLDRVRTWVRNRAGEEAMRRGLASGPMSKIGLLPTTLMSKWPDKAAALIDVGYVVVLVDGIHLAYIAPATAPAMLYGPLDATLARPISELLRVVRLILAIVVLMSSGTVVALMNYHQEMMPTQFLLALAAVRENAPFPIVLEVLLLECLQELVREAGFHLPARLGPGSSLIAGKILILILVQGGVVSALVGAVSVGIALIMLGLLNYDLIYTLRFWRLLMIAGAGIFGFFGMAAVGFLMLTYLTQFESFGVPFLGETGLHFTAPGRTSSRAGGKPHATRAAVR